LLKMFVKNCPKCGETINTKIYQKQEANSKVSCSECGTRWLVPNTALKELKEFKDLKLNHSEKPFEVKV